jgi:gliding motility-associated-like protein
LTVTSPDGCVASATVTNMICVFAFPVAEFSFGPQPTDILQTEISFTNETTLGITYEWDFAGLGTSQQTDPIFVFPNDEPGTYPVCLATVSVDGCMDTVCHDVVIDDLFLLYVPNTFTPDFDGVNDFFFPVIDGYDPENFVMMIFNRWGELIFETESPDNKWDGTYKSIMSKEDTYVWKIITKDIVTGKKRQFLGHVNLLK